MNRTAIIGGLGAVIVAVALGLNFWLNQEVPDDVAEAPAEEEAAGTGQPSNEVTTALPDAGGKAADESQEDADQRKKPSFDVVRVSEEGDTVIAGRAPSGSKVIIKDGGEVIGTATADERGEWVILPDKPLPPGNRELTLEAQTKEGETLESEDMVVLAVPEPGKNLAGEKTDKPSRPLAVLVPRSGKGGSRILQKPKGDGVSDETGGLVLDSVDYDDEGNMTLSGRGQPGARIRTYLDNEPLGTAVVKDGEDWQVVPEGTVKPGVYKLRVDQTVAGEVVGRIELPFSRAEPLTDFAGEAFVVVQPGNSLWRIARRTLGGGPEYTVIYEANKEQIRDPDLIYPGQVFEIPSN